MSEQDHFAAIKALLTTGTAAPYDQDEIKALSPLPIGYTELTLSQRFVGEYRNTASTGRTGWRITTRAVGSDPFNAREMRKRTEAALRYKRVTVDGNVSTPIQLESEDVIGPDDGRYSGLATWTYAI